MPFQDRIVFRLYKTKTHTDRHRYGIKVFKLCSEPDYTYSFQISTRTKTKM